MSKTLSPDDLAAIRAIVREEAGRALRPNEQERPHPSPGGRTAPVPGGVLSPPPGTILLNTDRAEGS